jgi:hypothetical protein
MSLSSFQILVHRSLLRDERARDALVALLRDDRLTRAQRNLLLNAARVEAEYLRHLATLRASSRSLDVLHKTKLALARPIPHRSRARDLLATEYRVQMRAVRADVSAARTLLRLA